jgi:hypothetical protein
MILQLLLGTFAWLLVGTLFLRLWQTTKAGITHLKKLHQVPCSRCAFFTGDYRLKCTVNPSIAMSEEAIDCRDFESKLHELTCSSCRSHSADESEYSSAKNLFQLF